MNTLQGMTWALGLRGVSHLARLCAICIADRAASDDGLHVVEIRSLLDFVEADYDQVLSALAELSRFGVSWGDNGRGSFACRLPAPAEARAAAAFDRGGQGRRLAIYVIGGGSICKIGISFEPAQRLANLQAAQPTVLLASHFTHLGIPTEIRRAKKLAHARLSDRLISNEWFNASPDECIAAVKAALVEASEVKSRRRK